MQRRLRSGGDPELHRDVVRAGPSPRAGPEAAQGARVPRICSWPLMVAEGFVWKIQRCTPSLPALPRYFYIFACLLGVLECSLLLVDRAWLLDVG